MALRASPARAFFHGPSPALATTRTATASVGLPAGAPFHVPSVAITCSLPSAAVRTIRQENPAGPPSFATMATSSLSPALRSFVTSTATGFSQDSPLAISLPLRRSVIRLSAVAVTIPFRAPPVNDLESRYSLSSLGPQIQSATPFFAAGTSTASVPAGCFSGSCSQRSAAALTRRPKPGSMRSEPRRHAAAVRNGMGGTRDRGDNGDGQAGNG